MKCLMFTYIFIHNTWLLQPQKNIQLRRTVLVKYQNGTLVRHTLSVFVTLWDWWIDSDPSTNLDLVDLNMLYWINYNKYQLSLGGGLHSTECHHNPPFILYLPAHLRVRVYLFSRTRCGLYNSTSSLHYSYVSGWFSYIVVTTALWMHDWAGSL